MTRILSFFLLLLPFMGTSQAIEATLLGHWENLDITPTSWLNSRYNDVWGDVINGKEYAIAGSTEGVHFFDLTDPSNLNEVAFVQAAATGANLVHRDYHSYAGYLYTVADEGPSTLQVIDMSGLPDNVEVVYDSNEHFSRAHNIFIDEANALLYAISTTNGSLVVLSLTDPTAPEFVQSFPNVNFNLPSTHDIYVRDNIAYINCANVGLYVADFTDPANPILLGTMTDYPQQGYNHSGWLSEDGNYYYLCDETHGMDVKVVDVSDHTDMHVVAFLNADSFADQIPHNAIVKDNLLYVSYYYDGVQVYDITDPIDPRRVAYYDTYPGPDDDFFAGAWGVYPLLPSGRVLVSDMNNGLFVIDKIEILPDFGLYPTASNLEACVEQELVFSLKVGDAFEANGVTLSTGSLPLGVTVEFSQNPVMPGESTDVKVNNLNTLGLYNITLLGSDDLNTTETSVDIDVKTTPPAVSLNGPNDGAPSTSLQPFFNWTPEPAAEFYNFEISTDAADFEDNLVFEEQLTGTPLFQIPNELEEGTTYFWRVGSGNDCGHDYSEMFTFTTKSTVSVQDVLTGSLTIHPNPVDDILNIQIQNTLSKRVDMQLINLNGQVLFQQQLTNNQSIDVSSYPAGVYFLKLFDEVEVLTKRIVVQ